jgi:putative ABC transport system permease protein
MTDILRDLRFGLRMLFRHPTVTFISLLTLALGIGASTAVFSVVDSTLLTPLPFEEPERLVRIFASKPAAGWTRMTVSAPDHQDWSEQSSSFEATGIYGYRAVGVMGEEHPDRLRAILASAGVLEVLRVRPSLGRTYDASSDQSDAAKVVLLSDATWRGRFGADPSIVGSSLKIDEVPHQVLGVLPPEVEEAMGEFGLWAPFTFGDFAENRANRWFRSIARLREDVTVADADQDLKVVGDRLAEAYPDSNRGHTASVESLAEVRLGREARPVLFALSAAVGFVLLIACVNIANLLLATASSREREFAVRTALGAGPRRLVRQLLTEAMLLTVGGAALGVAVAFWGTDILTAGLEATVGSLREATVNGRALGFTVVVLGLTSVGIGLPLAVRAAGTGLSEAIQSGGRAAKEGARGKIRRDVLVIVQVALALALLISSGLMIRSLMALKAVDPGFDTDNLLTLSVALPEQRYPSDAEKTQFFDSAVREISSLPGVRSASAVGTIPLVGSNSNTAMAIEDHPISDPADKVFVGAEPVVPGYLETIGIPLIEGRGFDALDQADSGNVVIINRFMARHFWPNESAVGKRVKYGPADGALPWFEVVGVMGDHRQTSLDVGPRFETLYPQSIFPSRALTFVVRTEVAPATLTATVQEAVRKIDPGLCVYDIATMDEIVARNTRSVDDLKNLLTGFGVVALVLALGGLYALMSFTVERRTREIGLRMALGAEAQSVLAAVLRKSAVLVLLGLLTGSLIAWWLSRWLQGMLFEISSLDLATYGAAAAAMLAVGLLAGLIPALRAARIDPMAALRQE